MNLDLQPVLLDELPKLFGSLLEFFTRGNVIEQSGADELDVLRGKPPTPSLASAPFGRSENTIKRTQEQILQQGLTHCQSSPSFPCASRRRASYQMSICPPSRKRHVHLLHPWFRELS